MLSHLEPLTPDPILGLMAAFRTDPAPEKIDLGVGVYKDESGQTPVLPSVRQAEQAVVAEQTTKTYVGPAGNPGFNAKMTSLVFGDDHAAVLDGRVVSLQACGGCAALRVGAELLRLANSDTVIHVSSPTWANHRPLLGNAGLELRDYPYYDRDRGQIDFDAMLSALEQAAEGEVVLLHGACHNPTGADLSPSQWSAVLELLRRRRLLPFIDLAYLGFGDGLEEDAEPIRRVASSVPEALVSVSCSKNFGMYRDRVGSLFIVAETKASATALSSQAQRIVRGLYSMPPDHGAAVADRVLGDAALRAQWEQEVAAMRDRMKRLRNSLADRLAEVCPTRDFSHLARQKGMFSLLGISPEQVRRLREEFHIYMTADSRTNVAGVSDRNLDYLAASVAAVVKS